ncbi:MAG: twin-arginine translocase TatA/TatE family subunit [Spirochaetales bacterium]|nr:twin-arginine translocase TatA/TatE family subunit [Spirochaetales bacterium]
MFNMGMSEFFIVFVVALLIVRPGDVPKVARSIGRFLGMIKDYRDTFMGEINSVKIDDKPEKPGSEKVKKAETSEGDGKKEGNNEEKTEKV